MRYVNKQSRSVAPMIEPKFVALREKNHIWLDVLQQLEWMTCGDKKELEGGQINPDYRMRCGFYS